MRLIGSSALAIRMPIIGPQDPLCDLVIENIIKTSTQYNIPIDNGDIIGITEAVVAKAQGNFATFEDIASDISTLFKDKTVGVVFPIMSRNRFLGVLEGISIGAKEVKVLLSWPTDEVGNPNMDLDDVVDLESSLDHMVSGKEFNKITSNYVHPFTQINYISLYESVGDNVEVYVSNKPEDILSLTDHVLVAEVHNRHRTKKRLLQAGAKEVYLLSDILNKPKEEGQTFGFHESYGVMGSNLSKDGTLKLFPRDAQHIVDTLSKRFLEETGKNVEILIYGDGAYKDPDYGIWELADPVISPAYTEKLAEQPQELKLKYVADQIDPTLPLEDKRKIIKQMIEDKSYDSNARQGTTPRKYADLIGSLCDLVGGSGDKGTPVIWIKGYFDNYATP